MNQFCKTFTALALGLAASVASAAPKQLVTHNNTSVESNAYIAGTIPSQYPTRAHSDSKVMWASVRLACYGHVPCWAVIKMATNTGTPIELGTVNINLDTGEITPKQISNNGYTMIVNGLAESTLIESNF